MAEMNGGAAMDKEALLKRVGSEKKLHRVDSCPFLKDHLTVVVIGASGDLAKKKTYPSLFALWKSHFLPEKIKIVGYARSKMSDADLRDRLRPFLVGAKSVHGRTDSQVEDFLEHCVYRSGGYEEAEAWKGVNEDLNEIEANSGMLECNRLFYFAVPPNVFAPAASAIKDNCWNLEGGREGWKRVIMEKPFGTDLSSFESLSQHLSSVFQEEEMYRIDHYLGKEMVANLLYVRFANIMFEPLWNRHYIKSVTITFKEDIGTYGRGGYFDKVGIVRDVMQNHLLQVMSIVAMEAPVRLAGERFDEFIRDEKVKVLECVDAIRPEEVVLGQYTASRDGSEPGYLEDEGVPKDSNCPTFATLVMWIRNQRWEGVPFILKAGKALNERKAEVRIQFHAAAAGEFLFPSAGELVRNELVFRMQPNEAIYMKANMKQPGLGDKITVSELDMTYRNAFPDDFDKLPDAYTRLILEVLRGKHAAFVREDELRVSWKIFTPLLEKLESQKPTSYVFGTRGPKESDELISKLGFRYHGGFYKYLKSIPGKVG
ncbi:Glucose-6-phosphate 1-dehydrogenase [Porphyridium purpureum]|uniref:Glucose-6-phosphate 1-dehydrogenase n=1 Tax=Porphyridium purpureum TaxID=35688 RepID=A0A5J4YY76_PORPP|nr:Glucose-6-phosphate 1-dehydrogenase [Porphyridium purpureum]|eukprot:POR9598..scf208_2